MTLEEAQSAYAEALQQLYRDKSLIAAAADLQDAEVTEKRTNPQL